MPEWRTVNVFFSYSHRDEAYRDEFERHLTPYKRVGLISTWHDRRIGAGEEWEADISEHLEDAQLVLLLVSADFLDSGYCYDVEMQRAIERHEAAEARVIPIILRHCSWRVGPLEKLQALPKDGRPVATSTDRDECWTIIAEKVIEAVKDLIPLQAPDWQSLHNQMLAANDELKTVQEIIAESGSQLSKTVVQDKKRYLALKKDLDSIKRTLTSIKDSLGSIRNVTGSDEAAFNVQEEMRTRVRDELASGKFRWRNIVSG